MKTYNHNNSELISEESLNIIHKNAKDVKDAKKAKDAKNAKNVRIQKELEKKLTHKLINFIKEHYLFILMAIALFSIMYQGALYTR